MPSVLDYSTDRRGAEALVRPVPVICLRPAGSKRPRPVPTQVGWAEGDLKKVIRRVAREMRESIRGMNTTATSSKKGSGVPLKGSSRSRRKPSGRIGRDDFVAEYD